MDSENVVPAEEVAVTEEVSEAPTESIAEEVVADTEVVPEDMNVETTAPETNGEAI